MCAACAVGWHTECSGPLAQESSANGLFYFCCCQHDEVLELAAAETEQAALAAQAAEQAVIAAQVAAQQEALAAIDPADYDIDYSEPKQRPEPKQKPGPKIKTEFKDQQSTGRKRAAREKPLMPDAPCEWAGLLYAGGGIIPIVGCAGNLQTNIHHGPDKSTINNSWENLHRICATCHNRWHTANDRFYPGERPENGQAYLPVGNVCLPHDPVSKAPELIRNEQDIIWAVPKLVRGDYDRTDLEEFRARVGLEEPEPGIDSKDVSGVGVPD